MRQPLKITTFCLLLPMAGGCVGLGQTQSAQTLPSGQVQHGFGIEWYRAVTDREEILLPFGLPFYQTRIGLAQGVELGVRTNVTFTNIGVDLKLQPVDTEVFDLSIDPTLQYSWVYGWAQLPILVGFNFNENIQLTLSGRIAYAIPLLEDDTDHLEEIFRTDNHLLAGGGASIYLRVSRKFAIVPEIQLARSFDVGEPFILSVSLGFTVGGQPGVTPDPEPEAVEPTHYGPGWNQPVRHLPDRQPAPNLSPQTPPGYGPPLPPATAP